jgi:hypothetical protein
MLAIGQTDSAYSQWGGKIDNGPHTLYIPDPGARENVNADHYRHVGWINPHKAGDIQSNHVDAGPDSRPAYVIREAAAPAQPTGVIRIDGPISGVKQSTKHVGSRNDEVAHVPKYDKTTEPPMTFYDHAFIAVFIASSLSMSRDMAVKDAHDVAAYLTRNRAN